MLLVIDVGNTNFVLGLYKKEKLVKCWRMTTGGNRTADETGIFIHGLFDAAGIDAGKVEAVIISSVVPDIMYSLTQGIRKYFNIEPMIVGVGMKTGIVIKRDDPKSVTGFITPGISSCAEALYQKAAQLPKIEIKAPKSIIAKNTVDSFQAGLVLGHIGQTKYIIEQLKEKLNLPNMKVIATGGLARVIDPKGEIFDVLDPVLTLKGLRILYEKNK